MTDNSNGTSPYRRLHDTAFEGATQSRVLFAMCQAAREAFAPNSTATDAYKSAAKRVLLDPRSNVERFAMVVVTKPSIATALVAGTAVTDDAIKTACAEMLFLMAWEPAPPPQVTP